MRNFNNFEIHSTLTVAQPPATMETARRFTNDQTQLFIGNGQIPKESKFQSITLFCNFASAIPQQWQSFHNFTWALNIVYTDALGVETTVPIVSGDLNSSFAPIATGYYTYEQFATSNVLNGGDIFQGHEQDEKRVEIVFGNPFTITEPTSDAFFTVQLQMLDLTA